MAQTRETVTDRLFNVIQVIQLGRKSGLLTVERGDGSAFEEGTVIFVNGQVTQAHTVQRHGVDAFDWLSTWGYCRFAFISLTTEEVRNTSPSTSIPRSSLAHTLIDADTKDHRQLTRTDPQAGVFTNEYSYKEEVGQKSTDPLMSLVPKRTKQVDEALWLIEQTRLHYLHRRLFLLIDGYRGITELVRLTGRKQDEVYKLLGDLVRAGMIHF